MNRTSVSRDIYENERIHIVQNFAYTYIYIYIYIYMKTKEDSKKSILQRYI